MKKMFFIAITPLLFMDACSSVKVEKRNPEAKHRLTSMEAIAQITGTHQLIRVKSLPIHKSLIISDNGNLEHDITLKVLQIPPYYKTYNKKADSSVKTFVRAKF